MRVVIGFQVSAEERATLIAEAGKRGLPLSTLIRQKLKLGRLPKLRPGRRLGSRFPRKPKMLQASLFDGVAPSSTTSPEPSSTTSPEPSSTTSPAFNLGRTGT